jgi:hypothetical protein
MKRVLLALALVALLAAPSLARENVPYNGTIQAPSPSRADIELEWDGGSFVAYGTSPGWTDETAVVFEAPAGGPFTVAEVRYYVHGSSSRPVHFWPVDDLWGVPYGTATVGPDFVPGYPSFPPADFTTVDVTGMGLTMETGDVAAPGLTLHGDGDGIGLAYAYDDGNPGHSWSVWGGSWTDDTYVYGYDDGIRLGLNYGGGSPTEETTWGSVKGMFR